jgi:hypothetical protein
MTTERPVILPQKTGRATLKFFSFIILFSCYFNALAQDVKVSGGFLSDSVKIGQETAFYLSARYPSNLNVIFPDSAFDFAPFEFERKNYFPTNTTHGISVDSTVYYLSTFEIESLQTLSLPVYILNERDCTTYASNVDSVKLVELVAQVPDSIPANKLPLIQNTQYIPVYLQFNYIIAIIAVAVLITLSVIVWIVFGKRILRHFKTRRLLKKHSEFMVSYTKAVDEIQKAFSAPSAENALSLWKKYLEHLELRPYTKLTSRELMAVLNDQPLIENLRNIDKAIYGHNTSVVDSLHHLKGVADQRFNQKLEEVKHGK